MKSIERRKEEAEAEIADIRRQLKKQEEKLKDSEEDLAHKTTRLEKKEKEIETLREELKRGQVCIGNRVVMHYRLEDSESIEGLLSYS